MPTPMSLPYGMLPQGGLHTGNASSGAPTQSVSISGRQNMQPDGKFAQSYSGTNQGKVPLTISPSLSLGEKGKTTGKPSNKSSSKSESVINPVKGDIPGGGVHPNFYIPVQYQQKQLANSPDANSLGGNLPPCPQNLSNVSVSPSTVSSVQHNARTFAEEVISVEERRAMHPKYSVYLSARIESLHDSIDARLKCLQ